MPVIQEPVALSIENILLATDFSASSRAATAYAMGLARRFGSKIKLAHVFDPSIVTAYEEAIIGFPPALRREVTEESMERLQTSFLDSGIKTQILISEGHQPAKELLKIAREEEVDLIVAGTESKTGIDRLLLGSTAEQLIRNAPCPVLTIGPAAVLPTGDAPLAFHRILYATDFSPEAAKAAIFALSFAEDSGAKLTCCYVQDLSIADPATRMTIDEAFKKVLRNLIPEGSYDWCDPEVSVEHGQADEAILGLAERIQADLIVLGARKSSFWLTRIERGLTPMLLGKAGCPVLTVS